MHRAVGPRTRNPLPSFAGDRMGKLLSVMLSTTNLWITCGQRAAEIRVEVTSLAPYSILALHDDDVPHGLEVHVTVPDVESLSTTATILCCFVNGTLHGQCVTATDGASVVDDARGLVLHPSLLGIGVHWVHVELFELDAYRRVRSTQSPLVSSRPLPVKVVDRPAHPVPDPRSQVCVENSSLQAGAVRAPYDRVTLALNLVLDDLPRAALLLSSLECFVDSNDVHQVVAVVPDSDFPFIKSMLQPMGTSTEMSNVRCLIKVVAESELLGDLCRPEWDTYAVQMALKLLVATMVDTEFYVTLDADVLATRCIGVRDLVRAGGRAVYVNESRGVHPHWWEGSQHLLGFEECEQARPCNGGFGVTPAVLSTAGSMLVLARLHALYAPLTDLQHRAFVVPWLMQWKHGTWWSEYTMYRLVLDRRRVFDQLHHMASDSDKADLLCSTSVWGVDELPWDPRKTFSDDSSCMFVVIQSSTGVRAGDLARALRQYVCQGCCHNQDVK